MKKTGFGYGLVKIFFVSFVCEKEKLIIQKLEWIDTHCMA